MSSDVAGSSGVLGHGAHHQAVVSWHDGGEVQARQPRRHHHCNHGAAAVLQIQARVCALTDRALVTKKCSERLLKSVSRGGMGESGGSPCVRYHHGDARGGMLGVSPNRVVASLTVTVPPISSGNACDSHHTDPTHPLPKALRTWIQTRSNGAPHSVRYVPRVPATGQRWAPKTPSTSSFTQGSPTACIEACHCCAAGAEDHLSGEVCAWNHPIPIQHVRKPWGPLDRARHPIRL